MRRSGIIAQSGRLTGVRSHLLAGLVASSVNRKPIKPNALKPGDTVADHRRLLARHHLRIAPQSALDCRFATSFASTSRSIQIPAKRFLAKVRGYFDFQVARADAQSAARAKAAAPVGDPEPPAPNGSRFVLLRFD